MLNRLSILISFTISILLISCTTKHSEIVLAEFGDNVIAMDEFEKAYAKNVGGFEEAKDDSLSKYRNFLDLYLNFRMKLRDAKVRGFEYDKALNDELIDYKKKIGVTYLLEKEIVEPGIKELYNRRKWELRVSHIMIRPDSGAHDFAQKLLDSIKQGASFEEMAQKYSEDTFSKSFGGDIYFITAGMLPVEFEDASYNTEEGKVYPEVMTTRFGEHIIKVTDKRERIPQVKASHILVDFKNDEGEIDSIAAKARIDSIVQRIKNGEDFALLAAEYSEDPGSKERGGDLGFFERRVMVKEFDEVAFDLDVNQVSDVVRTNYGYHVIKVTGKKEHPTLEEERDNLKNIFQRTRYQAEVDKLVDSLKVKYNFTTDEEAFNFIADNIDSVTFNNAQFDEQFDNKIVITFADKKVSASDYIKKLSELNEFSNKLITFENLKQGLKKASEDYLLEEEALNLDKTSPEFASLMQDYKNGIFIFKLQEDEVWNKLELDSAKLYNYYSENQQQYTWPDRISYSEIFSRKDSLIKHYHALLKNGADFDSLASEVTERAGFKEKAGAYGLQPVTSSKLTEEANKLEKPGDFSEPFQNSNGYSIVKLNEKSPARLKTFEEARAEVSGALQDLESKRLEQEYIQKLKNIYKPEVYYDKLSQAFQSE